MLVHGSHLEIAYAAFLLVTTCCYDSAQAQTLTIVNPGFETPVTPAGTFSGGSSSAPNGWSVYNTGATNSLRQFGVINPAGTQFFTGGVPSGANAGVVFLQNTTEIAEAGLRQNLSSTLQINTRSLGDRRSG